VQAGSSSGGLCSLFDIQLVVRMTATSCKRREHYGRAIIFLVIIAVSVCIINMEGKDKIFFCVTELDGVISTLASYLEGS
jgi:hypothetical protein